MECMRNQLVEGRVLDGRYETISPLNHGSFGLVFMARDLVTRELVALKCLTKSTSATSLVGLAVDDRSEELKLHLAIGSHPNIVNLLHSFETPNHAYLVLEFCPNGDLYEAIRIGKGPLQTEHVMDFMIELVDAVEHLHSKGIYHRDIKPENIFLSQSGSMKLGDFGLATTEQWSFESAVGSDRYMAPEQYDPGNTWYSPAKADIWALGIVLLNVLFSKNPFGTPTVEDPLFADFLRDRQTLFDIFPSMSQDTFEVLIHCLAIDPEKRSLSAVRDALDRVITFTTDDEAMDDFCTTDHDVVGASANREPLRTPSMTSPQLDQGGSFPWAKALAMTPQQPVRQLSVIPDEHFDGDLFPESIRMSQDWYSVKPDSASTISFVDSGLGVSYKSTESTPQPEPITSTKSKAIPIAGSLPISISKHGMSLSSVFGKKRDPVSKSWSDMWDEDEEIQFPSENENTFSRVKSPKPTLKERFWGRESESGNSTPRAGLTEMKNPSTIHNSRNRTPPNEQQGEESVSEQTGFMFEPCQPASSPNATPGRRSIMEKWAALGDRRRGNSTTTPPKAATPQKRTTQKMTFPKSLPRTMEFKATEKKTAAPPPTPSPGYPRKRSRGLSWRNLGWGNTANIQNNNTINHGVWERKDWSVSANWRDHPDPPQVDNVGELEWVGGYHDLHL